MALQLWETLKEAIVAYTGLSPTTFFTIPALLVAVYHVVSGLFGSSHDHRQLSRNMEETQPLPPPVQLGEITEDELKQYDGSDAKKPLLMAIKGSDLVNVRKVLGPHAKNIQLMSKVENQEGVINFDEILRETDSFMVARGDLGMEIPVEKIFLAQKMVIYKCNLVGKPVVTATQMLESMIKSPRPTRAEVTDVANVVFDGTDCVMLSGEGAAGSYPELAVKIMARICIEAESSLDYRTIFKEMIKSTPLPMSPLESLASSAVRTANRAKAKLIVVLTRGESTAKLIVVLTRGESTAKLVAKYRPAVPILSVVVPVLTTDSFDWTCSDETPARHSLIYRGLIPLLAEGSAKATDAESTEVILEAAMKSATERGLCTPGDAVVALHRIGVASVIKICAMTETIAQINEFDERLKLSELVTTKQRTHHNLDFLVGRILGC